VTLEVLLFGGAAAAANSDRAVVRVLDPCTCAGVLAALRESAPALGPYVDAGRLAVNHAFAPPDRVIGPTDEVALISLVSGG